MCVGKMACKHDRLSTVEHTLRGKYISIPRMPTSLGREYSEIDGVEMGTTIVYVQQEVN